MIHEAYMPVYRCQDFWRVRAGLRVGGLTRGSTRGPRGPKNGPEDKGIYVEEDIEDYW